jgi:hypothetical protein
MLADDKSLTTAGQENNAALVCFLGPLPENLEPFS